VTAVTLPNVLVTRTQTRVLRRAAVAALVPLSVSGCLLNTRTAEGRALHDAPRVLARSGSVDLALSVASRLVRQGSLTTLPGADPGYRVRGVLDLSSGRASYAAAGRTVAVFDRNRAYALRPHARPDDARPWVQVTVDDHLQDLWLDPSALPPSLAALALRPSVLVDALSGALTGSIDKVGAEDVDGTPTTKYTARFDLTQALSESKRHRYSQRQQDDLAKLFGVLGIKRDALNDGAVWLDAQGAPRRLQLALRESPTPQSLILLLLDLRLTPRRRTVVVDVPDGNAVTTVPSLFQFLQPLKTASAV
jgi:hypothetical protein